ncbi:putative centrosomal protein [Monocercomonoides exilis]|uniref:putative centrosomal protein n=1 Tax=Monocercomonoides exilis TaxID=2049356 RepID=UPI0035594C27|nr:putative centrosomal protein [Monocercomonoides exilis]|eukprot:MONOS_11501.1-p1 / transcript=MONOS_11501.1 / gene=MONOS_11501 / organism=Monocercomonoides_exilis_PA203 / gene_product=unspecified product / transcript_product=unspecified product / location=Mono_scaffold00581:4640-10156(-) / protein_length=1777 / sequence_SO=supercontig / SO=protein_coding / is_pseudo=false
MAMQIDESELQGVLEYADYMGMTPLDNDLFWIAREGFNAALPDGWVEEETPDHRAYYYNEKTGASMWDHPLDDYYRNLYEVEKRKKELLKQKQRASGNRATSPNSGGKQTTSPTTPKVGLNKSRVAPMIATPSSPKTPVTTQKATSTAQGKPPTTPLQQTVQSTASPSSSSKTQKKVQFSTVTNDDSTPKAGASASTAKSDTSSNQNQQNGSGNKKQSTSSSSSIIQTPSPTVTHHFTDAPLTTPPSTIAKKTSQLFAPPTSSLSISSTTEQSGSRPQQDSASQPASSFTTPTNSQPAPFSPSSASSVIPVQSEDPNGSISRTVSQSSSQQRSPSSDSLMNEIGFVRDEESDVGGKNDDSNSDTEETDDDDDDDDSSEDEDEKQIRRKNERKAKKEEREREKIVTRWTVEKGRLIEAQKREREEMEEKHRKTMRSEEDRRKREREQEEATWQKEREERRRNEEEEVNYMLERKRQRQRELDEDLVRIEKEGEKRKEEKKKWIAEEISRLEKEMKEKETKLRGSITQLNEKETAKFQDEVSSRVKQELKEKENEWEVKVERMGQMHQEEITDLKNKHKMDVDKLEASQREKEKEMKELVYQLEDERDREKHLRITIERDIEEKTREIKDELAKKTSQLDEERNKNEQINQELKRIRQELEEKDIKMKILEEKVSNLLIEKEEYLKNKDYLNSKQCDLFASQNMSKENENGSNSVKDEATERRSSFSGGNNQLNSELTQKEYESRTQNEESLRNEGFENIQMRSDSEEDQRHNGVIHEIRTDAIPSASASASSSVSSSSSRSHSHSPSKTPPSAHSSPSSPDLSVKELPVPSLSLSPLLSEATRISEAEHILRKQLAIVASWRSEVTSAIATWKRKMAQLKKKEEREKRLEEKRRERKRDRRNAEYLASSSSPSQNEQFSAEREQLASMKSELDAEAALLNKEIRQLKTTKQVLTLHKKRVSVVAEYLSSFGIELPQTLCRFLKAHSASDTPQFSADRKLSASDSCEMDGDASLSSLLSQVREPLLQSSHKDASSRSARHRRGPPLQTSSRSESPLYSQHFLDAHFSNQHRHTPIIASDKMKGNTFYPAESDMKSSKSRQKPSSVNFSSLERKKKELEILSHSMPQFNQQPFHLQSLALSHSSPASPSVSSSSDSFSSSLQSLATVRSSIADRHLRHHSASNKQNESSDEEDLSTSPFNQREEERFTKDTRRKTKRLQTRHNESAISSPSPDSPSRSSASPHHTHHSNHPSNRLSPTHIHHHRFSTRQALTDREVKKYSHERNSASSGAATERPVRTLHQMQPHSWQHEKHSVRERDRSQRADEEADEDSEISLDEEDAEQKTSKYTERRKGMLGNANNAAATVDEENEEEMAFTRSGKTARKLPNMLTSSASSQLTTGSKNQHQLIEMIEQINNKIESLIQTQQDHEKEADAKQQATERSEKEFKPHTQLMSDRTTASQNRLSQQYSSPSPLSSYATSSTSSSSDTLSQNPLFHLPFTSNLPFSVPSTSLSAASLRNISPSLPSSSSTAALFGASTPYSMPLSNPLRSIPLSYSEHSRSSAVPYSVAPPLLPSASSLSAPFTSSFTPRSLASVQSVASSSPYSSSTSSSSAPSPSPMNSTYRAMQPTPGNSDLKEWITKHMTFVADSMKEMQEKRRLRKLKQQEKERQQANTKRRKQKESIEKKSNEEEKKEELDTFFLTESAIIPDDKNEGDDENTDERLKLGEREEDDEEDEEQSEGGKDLSNEKNDREGGLNVSQEGEKGEESEEISNEGTPTNE